MIPSELLNSIKEKAKKLKKTVVLPDATDERTLKAARIIADEGIAHPILVGDENEIRLKASAINTFAFPSTGLPGDFDLATCGTIAASSCNSPSTIN